MSEERVPYLANIVRDAHADRQDDELTMALSALKRLQAALEAVRSREASSQQKAQAFLEGQQVTGLLQALLEDWSDELVALWEGEEPHE